MTTNTKLLDLISRYIDLTNSVPFKFVNGTELFIVIILLCSGLILFNLLRETKPFFSRVLSMGIVEAYKKTMEEEHASGVAASHGGFPLKGYLLGILVFIILIGVGYPSLYLSTQTSRELQVLTNTLNVEIKKDITENYLSSQAVIAESFKPTDMTKPDVLLNGGVYKVSFIYNDEQYNDKIIFVTYNKSVDSNTLVPFEDKDKYKGLSNLQYGGDYKYSRPYELNDSALRGSYSEISMERIDYIYNLKIN